ncbi:helix-turn-helix domain-containing protein [Curtobacterium sp. NPDC086286]|jgi:hypothetical protein|uniref:AlbA family DNA-binding domain-containing protein n=1 Tax=Curtobacterium sp. NPDC086286 TaxID=3363964 RepID=UPI003825A4CA
MNWPPQTEADVLAALERGDVVESSQLDVKLLVGSSDGERRGTAKDLASFAIDGGALLIGVREDKANRKFTAEPIDLNDVVERIELIAATLVEPSLPVHPREIPSEKDGFGYVWVDIPESPDAPHMVDKRYYGRGERTNRKLGDAEVIRLHRARGSELELSRAALDALHNQDRYLSARPGADPHAEPVAEHGHLYLVATPHRRIPGLADDLLWESQEKLRAFDQASDAALNDLLRNWASHLATNSQLVQRSTAISLTNFREDLGNDRFMEQYGMELRIEADGTIGLIYTGFSDAADGEQPGVIQDGTLVGGAWKLLGVARSVAQHVGYTGSWDIALRATHLQGRQSSVLDAPRRHRGPNPAFDQPEHEQFTRVDWRELERPAPAVRRLTRPLLRAVGSWKVFEEHVPELGAMPPREGT